MRFQFHFSSGAAFQGLRVFCISWSNSGSSDCQWSSQPPLRSSRLRRKDTRRTKGELSRTFFVSRYSHTDRSEFRRHAGGRQARSRGGRPCPHFDGQRGRAARSCKRRAAHLDCLAFRSCRRRGGIAHYQLRLFRPDAGTARWWIGVPRILISAHSRRRRRHRHPGLPLFGGSVYRPARRSFRRCVESRLPRGSPAPMARAPITGAFCSTDAASPGFFPSLTGAIATRSRLQGDVCTGRRGREAGLRRESEARLRRMSTVCCSD